MDVFQAIKKYNKSVFSNKKRLHEHKFYCGNHANKTNKGKQYPKTAFVIFFVNFEISTVLKGYDNSKGYKK